MNAPKPEGDEVLDQPVHVNEGDGADSKGPDGEHIRVHDGDLPADNSAELLHHVEDINHGTHDDSLNHQHQGHLDDAQETTGNVVDGSSTVTEGGRDEL